MRRQGERPRPAVALDLPRHLQRDLDGYYSRQDGSPLSEDDKEELKALGDDQLHMRLVLGPSEDGRCPYDGNDLVDDPLRTEQFGARMSTCRSCGSSFGEPIHHD